MPRCGWAGFFPAAKLKQNYPECTHESGVVEKAGLSFGSALTGGGPLEGPLAWHPAGGEGSPGGGGRSPGWCGVHIWVLVHHEPTHIPPCHPIHSRPGIRRQRDVLGVARSKQTLIPADKRLSLPHTHVSESYFTVVFFFPGSDECQR